MVHCLGLDPAVDGEGGEGGGVVRLGDGPPGHQVEVGLQAGEGGQGHTLYRTRSYSGIEVLFKSLESI